MTEGVGGSSAQAELSELSGRTGFTAITVAERLGRIEKAQRLMVEQGIDALYLDASTNLYYFTGLRFWATERLHGAIIPARGDIIYISPGFEEEKTRAMLLLGNDVRTWEEHEDPTALVGQCFAELSSAQGVLAIDPATPFFVFDGLRRAMPQVQFINGSSVTASCRMYKSGNEIALIQFAMDLT
jgi:Xaa-Pro dipeptidase